MGDRSWPRISVAEMKSFYLYSEWVSWLLSVAEGESGAWTAPGLLPGWAASPAWFAARCGHVLVLYVQARCPSPGGSSVLWSGLG